MRTVFWKAEAMLHEDRDLINRLERAYARMFLCLPPIPGPIEEAAHCSLLTRAIFTGVALERPARDFSEY